MSCARGKSTECVENGVGGMIKWGNEEKYNYRFDFLIFGIKESDFSGKC